MSRNDAPPSPQRRRASLRDIPKNGCEGDYTSHVLKRLSEFKMANSRSMPTEYMACVNETSRNTLHCACPSVTFYSRGQIQPVSQPAMSLTTTKSGFSLCERKPTQKLNGNSCRILCEHVKFPDLTLEKIRAVFFWLSFNH